MEGDDGDGSYVGRLKDWSKGDWTRSVDGVVETESQEWQR